MRPLTSETRIALAPGAKVEFREGAVWASAGGARVDAGAHGLAVIELFRAPQPMAQALAQLARRESDAKIWMQASAIIYRLWEAGVLCEANTTTPVEVKPLAQSGIHAQARMLNDRTRTERFLRAIRATVKPGDVVVDLGTGSGILAIAAAQAGAKHVYAIEMTGLADVAEAMFAANGLSNRITMLRGKSTTLELPGGAKANVLITETIGDSPLSEGIMVSVDDARRRLLAPGAKIIPEGITMGAVPVRLPDDLLDRYIFSAKNTERWQRNYGIDFSVTQRTGRSDDMTVYRLRTHDYLRCEWLAPAMPLARVDFASFSSLRLEGEGEITLAHDGPVHGWVLWFDLDIGAGEWFSTAPPGTKPHAISPDNCWRIPVWLRLQPLAASAGQKLKVKLRYADLATSLEVSA